MRLAGETACPTTGKSSACIGGTGFSLSTPACGRIFSQRLSEGLPPTARHHTAGGPWHDVRNGTPPPEDLDLYVDRYLLQSLRRFLPEARAAGFGAPL